MVKNDQAVGCIIKATNGRLIRPFGAPAAPAVWRYTVRQSADLSGLRALKKYR